MTSSTAARPTFHPDLERIARFIPRKLVTRRSLPLLQRLTALQNRQTPDDVEVLTLSSGVGVRLFRPTGVTEPTPALLWIHGGGYVLGSPAQDDALCRRFARELGATVAAVKYRLAPQNPYPAGLEDCYEALKWLVKLPAVDPSRVAVAGASAGGGLAASLALLARDRGEIPLAAQILVYPMLDDRSVGPELENPGHRLWTQGSNKFGWSAYLAGADPAVAVPGRRVDLAGLPPPGSALARWTCSMMRTWPTPSACVPQESTARWKRCTGRFTASTRSPPKHRWPRHSWPASVRGYARRLADSRWCRRYRQARSNRQRSAAERDLARGS